MTWTRYREFIEKTRASDGFPRAGIEIEFTEELCRVMEEQGVSRAELARRVETSPAYITKILRGSTNFTLATMIKLAGALGLDVRLHLAPRGSRTVWKDELGAPEFWPGETTEVHPRIDVTVSWENMTENPAGKSRGYAANRWTASVSATSVMEGEQDEGPAHQVA